MPELDFDTMLKRQIANGKEFENLIPKSSCQKTKSGIGETDFSMKEIKAMSEMYSWQMEQVANLLETSSLSESVANVKDFIYNHFQYKADQNEQMMRSPACSWFDRYNGIDCKSYSILASALLSEMNIKHYIRRIKQPAYEPNNYTHVYVVVPVNQETGSLQDGYYTVDGTLEEDTEPAFVQKDDIFMSLQHYRLNGAQPQGLSLGIGNFNFNNISIGNIGCMSLTNSDNSAYTVSWYNTTKEKLAFFYNQLILDINQAVIDGDRQLFNEAVNEFFGMSKVFVQGWERKRQDGWNKCTTERIDGSIQMAKFFRDVVGVALKAWLDDNFTATNTGQSIKWTNVPGPTETDNIENNDIGVKFIYTNPHVNVLEPLLSYVPKAKTINQFEITPYVASLQNNPSAFNPLQFISQLSQTLTSFIPSNTGNNNGSATNLNNNQGIDAPNNSNTAGFGTVGWVILGIGATWLLTGGFKGMDNPKKTK